MNLASYDMHTVEGMDQSLANLAMLEQSFGNICTKIEEKTARQRAKIAELKQRILSCNETIQQLQEKKQALAFISPSRYVRSYKFEPENNVSIFHEYLIRPSIKKFDMNTRYDMEHNIEKIGKESKIALNEINQMVELLYSKFKPKAKFSFEGSNSVSRKKKEGLGRIPSDLKYIDSLLVFNSMVNPYRHYQIIENSKIKKQERAKATNDLDEAIVLDKAPTQMNERINKNDPTSYDYVPEDKEVEDEEFDMQLELDGIVDFGEDFDDDAFNPSKTGMKGKKPSEPAPSKPKEEPKAAPPPKKETKPTPKPAAQKAAPAPTTSNSTLPPPPPPPPGGLPPPPPPPPPGGLPPPPSLSSLPPPPPLGGLPPPPAIGLPPPPTLNLPGAPPGPVPGFQAPAKGGSAGIILK